MACKCVRCAECGGTGNIWVSLSGEYLGNSRCDDFDELDTCEDCDGTGITETCDDCREWQEEEYDRMFEEEQRDLKRNRY